VTHTRNILYVKQSDVLEKVSLLQWNVIGDDTVLHMHRAIHAVFDYM